MFCLTAFLFSLYGDEMKNIIRILAVTILLTSISFLGGCQKEDSKLKQEVVQVANLSDLLDKIKADETFKKEDVDLFVMSLGTYASKMDSLNGKTVGQIMKDTQNELRKASVLGLTNTMMNLVHGFGYQGWQPVEANGQKYFQFVFAVQNKDKKEDIKNLEGILKFVTVNNQLIKGFRVKITQGVPANKIQQYNSTFVFDQNNKNDVLLNEVLVNKNPNVYTVWEPTVIEFNNGKKFVKESPLAVK